MELYSRSILTKEQSECEEPSDASVGELIAGMVSNSALKPGELGQIWTC